MSIKMFFKNYSEVPLQPTHSVGRDDGEDN
jgi:hypothetical protein